MPAMTPKELLDHYDAGRLWLDGCNFELPHAYQQALAVREMRIARGERPVGYKVGFTNRGIWPRYNVFAPIWGTVWDTTVSYCDAEGELSLARTREPRLEPETVFCFAATPPNGASLDELLECVQWVAPGFELVQTPLPGWKFVVADTAADGGLHARLLIGRRLPLSAFPAGAQSFERSLAATSVSLCRDADQVDEGVGANVLDGPLHALAHFVAELRKCPGAPDVKPGDVVTTGTWTDAAPVARGQQWTADFDGPLGALSVRFR
jgi:2-keto-4-pentenoate hydratase